MKVSDLHKLKVGERVVVTGTQDDSKFSGDAGVVKANNALNVLVRFDKWSKGHGDGSREWHFCDYDARGFTIVLEKPKAVESPKKKRPHGSQEYKGNGKHSWEHVTGDTQRLRVPGGWLYGTYSTTLSRIVNSTFVPTPEVVGYAI